MCKELFGTAEELAIAAAKHSNGFVDSSKIGGGGGGAEAESPKLFQSPSRSSSGSSQRQFYDRKRHHCRSCGQAVCNPCSIHRQPVPERGWNTDVRVCDPCSKSIKC